jgi:hypothetical protein
MPPPVIRSGKPKRSYQESFSGGIEKCWFCWDCGDLRGEERGLRFLASERVVCGRRGVCEDADCIESFDVRRGVE